MSDPVSDMEIISVEGDGGRSSILVEPRPAARDPEILLRTRLVDPERCNPFPTSSLYAAGQLLRTKVLSDTETGSRHQSVGPYLATSDIGAPPLSTTGEPLPSVPWLTSGKGLHHYSCAPMFKCFSEPPDGATTEYQISNGEFSDFLRTYYCDFLNNVMLGNGIGPAGIAVARSRHSF